MKDKQPVTKQDTGLDTLSAHRDSPNKIYLNCLKGCSRSKLEKSLTVLDILKHDTESDLCDHISYCELDGWLFKSLKSIIMKYLPTVILHCIVDGLHVDNENANNRLFN